MTRPVRLRLSRQKGFNLQALSLATNGLPAVKVDRSTPWGNPFDFRRAEWCWAALSFGCRGDAAGRQEASVLGFREWIDPGEGRRTLRIERQPKIVGESGEVALGPPAIAGVAPSHAAIIAALRGKNLGCWCGLGEFCHGDVHMEIANK